MKMTSTNCPNCGAKLTVDLEKKQARCEHCGSTFLVDDETLHIQFDNTENAGYNFEKGRQRARDEQCTGTPKKPIGIGWKILLWLFFFPFMLTIWIARSKKLKTKIKLGLIVILWGILLIVSYFNNKSEAPEPVTMKETEVASSAANKEESVTLESNELPTMADDQKESTAKNTEIRDESINGRGRADEGRSEPQYQNRIGYVVVSSTEEHELSNADDFVQKEPWMITTYTKDKQFWNETDVKLEHKTEVLVREQNLEHKEYGSYSGYLLVECTDNGEQYYINVSNFITKPYWTYENDLQKAALTGYYVAEFNQKSDYYPVTKDNEKVELSDGVCVLVKGITGLYGNNGPDQKTNQIEAIVWKEWKMGYGGVSVFFNTEDLKIVY